MSLTDQFLTHARNLNWLKMIDWEKYGFNEDVEYKGVYSHPKIPLMFAVHNNYLTIYSGEGTEYKISHSIIPATNRNIEMFVKAFCVGM